MVHSLNVDQSMRVHRFQAYVSTMYIPVAMSPIDPIQVGVNQSKGGMYVYVIHC